MGHTYTGQPEDATGLRYYHARYYDPLLGQFISPDTIIPNPNDYFSYNRYLYVRGNPNKYNDPSGHIFETILDVVDIGWSAYDLWQEPSWENAGYLGWSVAATVLPGVPGAWVLKGGKRLLDATQVGRLAIKHGDDLAQLMPVGYDVLKRAVSEFYDSKGVGQIYIHKGAEAFAITKGYMEQFLGRHHPAYWQGTTRKLNTSLDGALSIDDVNQLVKKTILEGWDNRKLTRDGRYEYITEIDDKYYKAVTNQGQVVDFFPCKDSTCN